MPIKCLLCRKRARQDTCPKRIPKYASFDPEHCVNRSQLLTGCLQVPEVAELAAHPPGLLPCLLACLPACLLVRSLARSLTHSLTCLLACLLVCVLACLLTHSLTCLLARLLIDLSSSHCGHCCSICC